MHKGHDSVPTDGKILEHIEQFEDLHVSSIHLRFLEKDKSSLTKTFIENKAKFHKSCGNKFSD